MSMRNRFWNMFGLQDEEEVVEHDRNEQYQDDHEVEPTAFDAKRNAKGGKVVSIHTQKNPKFVLVEPRTYDEAQDIADHLRSRRSVVVNLQRVRTETAMRLVDFLSGTVYALNGSISKLGPNIFLCAPESVEIQGAITDMLAEESEYNKMR